MKFGEDRAGGLARAEMQVAQFVHEGGPERRAALLEQLGWDRQLAADGCVAAAPGAHLREEGHELDRGFGLAVGGFLPVRGVGPA